MPAKKKTRSKAASKKTVAKKATAKKKSVSKTAPAKKTTTGKKAPAKKSAPKKTAAKRAAARRGSAVNGFEDFTPYKVKKGEEYMSPEQVEHFRKLLLDWRQQLMEEVDRTVHHMQNDAATYADPNDRATQEEEFALELRTRDRERKLIKKISESLAALEAGEYGYCEACGEEIGIKRLEARPTATLCIDCKTLAEIKEKQMA